MRKQNEKGITLIEVLVTLSLVTVVGGIIVSIIISGFKHYDTLESSNNLRSQANETLVQLLNIHQQSKNYTLEFVDEHTLQIHRNKTNENKFEDTIRIDFRNLVYELTIEGNKLSSEGTYFVDLKETNQLYLNVQLTLKTNDDTFTIDTILSRLTPA